MLLAKVLLIEKPTLQGNTVITYKYRKFNNK